MTLTVQHKIFITREQAYALHEGNEVDLIGISIPVWVAGTNTTEPAKEIFCKYFIKNTRKEVPLKIVEEGYEITLPFKEWKNDEIIENEEFRNMSDEERNAFYERKGIQASSKNLLDVKEKGSECLNYTEQNKLIHNDKELNIFHFISIERMNYLTDSVPELIQVDNL